MNRAAGSQPSLYREEKKGLTVTVHFLHKSGRVRDFFLKEDAPLGVALSQGLRAIFALASWFTWSTEKKRGGRINQS